MKRCLLLIIVASLPMLASAYDFECDGLYYRQVSIPESNHLWAAVTKMNGYYYTGDVIIPYHIKKHFDITNTTYEYYVEGVDSYAFAGCTGLTSVTFPASSIKIRHHAFEGCSGLTSLTIPGSIETIEETAFSGCNGLKSIIVNSGGHYDSRENCNAIIESRYAKLIAGCMNTIIPNSVRSIGQEAFAGCMGLKTITIPSSVKSIAYNAFTGCYFTKNSFINNSSLTSSNNWGATIIDEETSDGLLIRSNTIVGCRNWATSVIIPSYITCIGDNAFSGCNHLTSIDIPSNVTSIGERAFSGCSKLTSIAIPESLTYINNYVFSDCTGMTSVTIPSSVTKIGEGTFSGCAGLTSVNLPISVTSIGERAFSGCSGLTSITIPNSVTDIGMQAFMDCTNLNSITIPQSIISISQQTFSGCTGLTSITIPNSVTTIGEGAFSGCTGLTSITIPNSVTTIGEGAFSGCTSLSSVIIPESVTSIGSGAFMACNGLTSLTIPVSVTGINETTFYGCSNIISLNIDCEAIENWFSNIKTIQTISLGEHVKTIGSHAFYKCDGLTSVIFPDSVTSIGEWAFYGCSKLTSIAIPKSLAYINNYVFSGCAGLTSVTIPSSVTKIGEGTFSGCAGLTSVNLPISVTSIGERAFSGCSGLTSITIPNSVTDIGMQAFMDCTNLNSITIPQSIISISQQTFSGCTGLTSITIPNSVTNIGNNAFSGCTGLTSITIPDSVTNIGDYAFSGCTSLTLITIGRGVTSIGNCVFCFCSSMSKVKCFAENVPSTNNTAFDKSSVQTACLRVPLESVFKYKTTSPWRSFGSISWLEDEIEDDNYIDGIYYNFSQVDAEVTKGDVAYSGEVVIPASVIYKGKTYAVTCIGNNAFADCSNMISLKIPSTLKMIKSGAFKNCTSLSKIIVTDIASWCGIVYDGNTGGDFPMYYAKHLYSNENTEIKDVVIPEGVTRIEALAFRDAKYITSITIPKSVTYIGREAFRGTHSLTSIVFPQNISSIEPYTCQDCEALTFVDIPEGVTNIGDNAFAKCYDMKDFYCYAENVPTTGNNVFKSSTIASATLHVPKASVNLYKSSSPWSNFGSIVSTEDEIEDDTYIDGIYYSFTENDAEVTNGDIIYSGKVVIPSSVSYKGKTYPVTSIGENAFSGCTGLTSVTIPNSVTSIEKEAFNGCNNITSLNLDCENIEYWFHDCQKSLSTLIFGDNVKTIGGDTFQDCSYLTTVTWGKNVASIGKEAFKNCSRLSSIVIPESVTSIGNATFKGCSSLNSIRIPNSITSIGNNAFSDCNGLTSIKVEDGNNIYDSRDNCNAIIITETNTLITGCQNTIIPNSVTAIGLEAFRGCSGLTSITIPASVTYVGDNAFKGCTSLKNVSMETNKPNKHFTRNNSDERWHDHVAISGTQGVNDSEDYTMLLDNDINTKWCVAHVDGTIYIEFDATCPIKPTEYMLTTGNDTQSNPGRNPKSWIIKGRNSTSDDWTTLTTVDDGNMPSESFVSKTFSLNTNTAYRYYRFEVTSLVSGTIFQLSEFCFLINDTSDNKRWLNYIATAGTPGFDTSENYPKLLDNDISTKWCTEYINGSIFIEFDATSSITPIGYELTTGNDTYWEPGRNPKSWIIKGRNETSDEWTTLTTVDDGNMPSESYASKTFSLNTNTSYRYYRFEVTSLVSGTIFQLSEFCFLVSDNNDEPIDDDTDVLVLGSNGSSPLFADCPLDSVFIGRNISYSTSSDKGYSPFYCNTPLRSVNISGAAKEVFSKEFYGCTNLKNVQIGGKMSTIGDYAFYGCTGLKEFYCEAEQTPAVTSSSFKNVDVSAVMLVVPDNSVELYKAHPIWRLFWVETETGLNEIGNDHLGMENDAIAIYNINGRKLSAPQKGINIIRMSDGTTRKVMIR